MLLRFLSERGDISFTQTARNLEVTETNESIENQELSNLWIREKIRNWTFMSRPE
jgi:hypothetical protein